MSEYLLLTVYRRYLEANGFEVEQKATISGGVVDLLAKSDDRILLVETKWVRSAGDVYEAVGRCVQNKIAMPEGTPIVVLPTDVASEEIRERVLGPCYKYGIQLHFVNINQREIFPDYLTTQIYPAIHSLLQQAQTLFQQGLSRPQIKAVHSLLSTLLTIKEPPELIDEVNLVIGKS
ncbi:MAG: hypothetical protein ACFFD8_10835 [Candidatus Thorarchaeota archaeon]